MSEKNRRTLPPNRRRSNPGPRRRPKVREWLSRWGRRGAELGVLAAAVVGLVVLGRWTHSYVTVSPHFAAGVADVTGNDRVTSEEIQELSGLEPGTNIFALSTTDAARRIEEHPWISSAKVSRRLPSQVSIEVVERQAQALLRLGSLYLIDGEGAIFKELAPEDPVDLPTITGVSQERLDGELPGARADLNEALALLRLYEESGLDERYPLSEIHLEPDGSLSIYTEDEATHIRLGRPPFRRKLRRLARLMGELRSRQAVADYVYLEESDDQVQPDRAVVRLRR